jgi:predicted nuclease of predicted toxin-antitoxin system
VSQLFIELYLDEDVDVLVAELVRARGFSAITTREANQLGANDIEQLSYAVNQQKTFFTHNRADFETLAQTYFATGQTHYGIIIAVRHSPYEIVRRLLLILNRVTADEMQDQVRYL